MNRRFLLLLAAASLTGCQAMTAILGDRVVVTFSEVATGSGSSCAATTVSSTYCWGSGGGMPTRFAPALVLHGFTSSSDHQCALDAKGAAWCWGSNRYGQLGIGPSGTGYPGEYFTVAKPVATTLLFTQLAANSLQTCGIGLDTKTYCWGDNDPVHPLGTIDTGERVDSAGVQTPYVGAPTQVTTTQLFTAITVGATYRCGVIASSDVYCWGQTATVKSPTIVAGGAKLKSVSAATVHTCGLDASGRAFCWGTNESGQLGTGDTLNKTNPTATTTTSRFTSVTSGAHHTCGITSAGAAFCWGANSDGRLGDGTTTRRTGATAVTGSLVFASISAGADYTCGVTTDGAAYCWGANASGQLGTGTKTGSLVPTPVRVP